MFEVYIKELKELLRDRKTLMFVIALPIFIFPVIFALIGFLMGQATLKAEQEVHTYYIANEAYAPEFAEKMRFHKSFKLSEKTFTTVEEMKEAIRNEELDVGIFIDKDARVAVTEGEQTTWQVVFNDASAINFIFSRVKDAATDFAKLLQAERFTAIGLNDAEQKALLEPILVEKVDTADKRENLGEKIGAFIPYILIPLVLSGAMYPAIDLGAGEKERGTLETLLLTPVTRAELVLGKLLTLLTASIATALITVVSFGFWLSLASSFSNLDKLTSVIGSLSVLELSAVFLLLVPLAVIFSSVMLAISIYARTFKEAQNYMTPFSILVFIPIVVSLMPNMELTFNTAMIPVTNVSLAIKEIIKGTVDYSLVGMIFVATAVLSAGLVALCSYWFKREDVLFR